MQSVAIFPGSGKSRAARAVACAYRELGILSSARVDEVAAAALAGSTPRESGQLAGEAIRRNVGGIVMITGADAWCRLPDRGQHLLARLYQELTEYRGDLAVILAGQAGGLRDLLGSSPPLAARFPAVIGFPGYTPAHLAGIFTTLAGEAGFTVTPGAARKAASVLAAARDGDSAGARLAVRLLDQAAACQARRITAAPAALAAVGVIRAADIPDQLEPDLPPGDDSWPGQYL